MTDFLLFWVGFAIPLMKYKQTPLDALIFFLLQRGKATIDLKKMLFYLIYLNTVPFKGKPDFVFSAFLLMYRKFFGKSP